MIVNWVEFLPMLICQQWKLPLCADDNYTHQKGWEFFLEEKLIAADLQNTVFGSSHAGVFIKKIKETKSGFHVLANETSWSDTYDKLKESFSKETWRKN